MPTVSQLVNQKKSLRMSLVKLQNRINENQQAGKDTTLLAVEVRATERLLEATELLLVATANL